MIRTIVDRHVIKANADNGTNLPPISAKKNGKVVARGWSVDFPAGAKLLYRPDKPLPNGARVWIESASAVVDGLTVN